MRQRNFLLRLSPLIIILIAVIFSDSSFKYFAAAISTASAEARSKPRVRQRSTYFVAENGSDGGPGTANLPWATINHAAEQADAGDTIMVRGGRYVLSAQVRLRKSGRTDAWITFAGYPGEQPVLDAQLVPHSALAQNGLDNGAFQIEGVSYVKVANFAVVNSHDAGITVRDSSHIDIINNSTKGTFSSGIAVWDTKHNGQASQHIRILGNTVTKATSWELASSEPRRGDAPHEAISIAGAVDFEVAYNHVYDSDKEGIDIKETSKRGKVHHNLVHNILRQGIYVDAWFGDISGIEISSNVVRDCHGAGLVLSVENGKSVEHVNIHNNLIFNNDGSGLYFSRWGVNGPRRNIKVHDNVFYHNGYGPPAAGQTYYWMTGGLYLYSTSVHAISIANNIFSENRGFQIGYSDLFLKEFRSWPAAAVANGIEIVGNLIHSRNTVDMPIESGGNPPDQVKIYAVDGDRAIFGDPLFREPAEEDFTLRPGSPAVAGLIAAGPYTPGSRLKLWWKRNFPPELFYTGLNGSR
jgi:Right handed beta helix region